MMAPQSKPSPWIWKELASADVGGAVEQEVQLPEPTVEDQLDEAFQQGYREGMEAGRVEAAKAMKSAVDAAVAASESVQAFSAEP